jgi:phosphoglycerate dehydrogenase-like enzyme
VAFDKESVSRGGFNNFTPEFLRIFDGLVEVPHEIIQLENSSVEEQVRAIKDADVLVCYTVAPEAIEAATHLKLIHSTGAGVDALLKAAGDSIRKKGTPLANVGGYMAVGVAEHAMALVLASAKDVVNRSVSMREGEWDTHNSILLAGKTMGIVGLGRIGVEVAKRGRAFGMSIIAIKRDPGSKPEEGLGLDFLGGFKDLDYVLKNSDFVVLCAPLTGETREMIGEKELRLMKPTAYLINIGRGMLTQDAALFRALKEGWIAGAGLDVWPSPPRDIIPSPSGVNKLRNVVASPHIAGITDQIVGESARTIAANVKRVYEGRTPVNLVDVSLGY